MLASFLGDIYHHTNGTHMDQVCQKLTGDDSIKIRRDYHI